MLKKMFKGILMGGALLALTVPAAQAADVNINLYGASAQHLFWNDAADDFLASQSCTGIAQDEYNSKHGITRGTCGADNVYIRYSSKASFDGIYAVKGAVNTDSCTTAFQRKMVDEASCTDWVLGGTACSALKCQDVTVGASDVAGDSFLQSSAGQLKGPNGGGYITRSFPATGVDTSGLIARQPVVVPFGFFANNTVNKTKCIGPDPLTPTPAAHKAVSTWGYQCYDPDEDGKSEDCIGFYKCVGGTCSGGVNSGNACTQANQCPDVALENTNCQRIPLDNISRIMAVNIFSGQAWYWTDFGAWYNSDPIVACLRHAGSGTHSTLDWAVMRSAAGDWGWPLVTEESAADPTVWFNDGSSDEMKCINTLAGAIGYADADQLEGKSNYENVHALKYNGIEPRRTKVRNGEYDFYSNQWLYFNHTPTVFEEALVSFASDPAKIPASKAKFWAASGEMVYNKSNDRVYPGYIGAGLPQLP
ncbi:MAG: hypothetical protein ABIL58_21245 [Pseudomonadota bacterium]